MSTSTTRRFTLSRVVTLGLIALLVAGLTYLRFAPGSGSVSVPEGAKAGDLILQPCDYATENGSSAADCGTLVVSGESSRRTVAAHRSAGDPDPGSLGSSREPIFILQGGPGHTNMTFDKVSRYADERDVVLVGYRGIDGSVRLDCPEVESALRHSTDLLSEKTSQAYADAFRSCANRLTDDGVDLGSYGISAAGRRYGGRAYSARLRPDRSVERERRDADGDHLFLALPGQHPPVGHGRRQPARPLPLVSGHHG